MTLEIGGSFGAVCVCSAIGQRCFDRLTVVLSDLWKPRMLTSMIHLIDDLCICSTVNIYVSTLSRQCSELYCAFV